MTREISSGNSLEEFRMIALRGESGPPDPASLSREQVAGLGSGPGRVPQAARWARMRAGICEGVSATATPAASRAARLAS